MSEKEYEEFVKNCYNKILHREPDVEGWNHYVRLLKTNQISKNELENIFKNSDEYKLSHPVEISENTSVEEWMKNDWEKRAKTDPLYVIATGPSESEESFWNSGISDCEKIIGKNSKIFFDITSNQIPKQMKVLEIGCGIGRILIPMSEVFGEAIGIDIAPEMVRIGKEKTAKIPNCKILECTGIDLSLFSDNYFDFCYSFIVFQHIPEKKIVEKYIQEVSRILKSGCFFRFQVRGTVSDKPKEITTWDGVQFSSNEIHKIAKENNFEIIEEGNDKEEYYWLTFKKISVLELEPCKIF